MRNDEQALSEDDNADLFGSKPEDHGSEIEQSLDLPSLSLDSLYVRSPLAEEHDVLCESKQSSVDGFDVSDGVSSRVPQPDDKTDDQGLYHREDFPVEGDDPGETQQNPNRVMSVEEIQIEQRTSSEGVAMNQSLTIVPQCESPTLPDQQRFHEDGMNIKHGDEIESTHEANPNDDCAHQRTELTRTSTSLIDNTNHLGQPSLIPTNKCEDKTASDSELDELPLSNKPETCAIKPNTSDETENSFDKLSPHVEVIKPLSPQNTPQAPVYTVQSLFPVVYEKGIPSKELIASPEHPEVMPILSASKNAQSRQKHSRRRRTEIHGNNLVPRLAALQAKLDAARNDLANTTRTHKLQLSMVETDNKMLSQRNARLKSQLSVVTSDLQRSNAEMAKLKTENEIYAAKLPRLQAELLEETSQVDETQAQSVQFQLVLGQLKARAHVLQTRNLSLEAQNNKLNQQLREYQQQLKRKTIALHQQNEKSKQVEAELNELKATNAQEKLNWKNRLATATQRFEHDKNKLETQFKTSERKELREANDRAEKAVKKRRTAETTTAKLEEQLKQCKRDLASANDVIQQHVRELRTLEALLRKVHRTEATLRNDLAACKTKLGTLQDEKKRRITRPGIVQTRRRLEQQIPIELLLPLSDSSDEEDNQEKECNHCCASIKSNEPQYPQSCSECPHLQAQLHQLQLELRRVRSLHNTELHAQASVIDTLLKRQLAVTPM